MKVLGGLLVPIARWLRVMRAPVRESLEIRCGRSVLTVPHNLRVVWTGGHRSVSAVAHGLHQESERRLRLFLKSASFEMELTLMMFTIASKNWSPGRPLSPKHDGLGLFLTRNEAESKVGCGTTVAVAVRYDAIRGTLHAHGPAAVALVGSSWTAPAIMNTICGVTTFAAIPAELVRPASPSHWQAHAGKSRLVPRPHLRLGLGGTSAGSTPRRTGHDGIDDTK
jgi:hypothetical protein